MMVVLLDEANGDVSLRRSFVDELARLGVTSVALLREQTTVGIVLEGWLFDPGRSASAVLEALGAGSRARALHPVLHLAVSTATPEGGRDVREISGAGA